VVYKKHFNILLQLVKAKKYLRKGGVAWAKQLRHGADSARRRWL
jgi:hypothetical protein